MEEATVKKYAPKKVFVLENNDYVEITYKELCEREKCDLSYKKKLFIPLHGMILEVDKDAYLEFYKTQRRQKYIYERSKDNNDISFDSLTTVDFNGENILIGSDNTENQAIRNIMSEDIRHVISMLKSSDRELIHAMFYEGLSERQ